MQLSEYLEQESLSQREFAAKIDANPIDHHTAPAGQDPAAAENAAEDHGRDQGPRFETFGLRAVETMRRPPVPPIWWTGPAERHALYRWGMLHFGACCSPGKLGPSLKYAGGFF